MDWTVGLDCWTVFTAVSDLHYHRTELNERCMLVPLLLGSLLLALSHNNQIVWAEAHPMAVTLDSSDSIQQYSF